MLSAARTGVAAVRTARSRADDRFAARNAHDADVEEAPPDGAEQPSRHDAEGRRREKGGLSPMALDAKVPGALKRNYVAALAVSLVSLGAGACGRHAGKPEPPQVAALAEAVRPAFFAEALRKLGGAHYHAHASVRVGPRGRRADWRHDHDRRVARPCGKLPARARRTIATAAARSSSPGASSPLRYAMGR